MVKFRKQSITDLSNILIGLITWEKHPLEYSHAVNYVDKITDICEKLDTKKLHSNTQYQSHKQYGNKVYKYRRNKSTTWYIIYNYDKINNIVYIEKILSNYVTTSE